jgi:exonuclease
MKKSEELRILLLDLELTFAVYYAYPSKREQYLSDKNIIHDQFCTCAAWKWHDERRTYAVKITDDKKQFKKDFRNDRVVAVKLHELMTEADVIVAHNGDNFDIKHANVLFDRHGLGPIPMKKSIDTLKLARKHFAFPGNSLDSLAKRFGGKGKNKKPNWYKMTDGDAKEIGIAATYCKNDVMELERVFKRIRPYINNYPIAPRINYVGDSCHKCRKGTFQKNGSALRTYGRIQRLQCNCCGAWGSGEKIKEN